MKRYFLIVLMILFLSGCAEKKERVEQAETGHIGADMAISREMTAKTIGMAFYSAEEMDSLKVDFSDVDETDWAYPYIAACVEQGFFAGGEEGDFRPKDDMTLWEAQALMERIAPDYDSRIVLTDENKNASVSYELWMQLLET
ncbi:MAG: S-layer homology domain-containing protein, partial [Anaerotignum sp.]|nr:S-layer homology domain-containing protein [Anaerotignum sp.]